jgi:hypothetical protein
MPEPRKIFRIEVSLVARRARNGEPHPASLHHAEIMQALGTLSAALAAPAQAAAQTSGGGPLTLQADRLARVAHELDAVTAGTAQATHMILAAAEEIDQLANNLSSALKGKIEQDLAQDISDLVIRIFEACNFQDVIGQRVNKVMTTLDVIEDHIAIALDGAKTATPASPPPAGAAHALHGPRLDGDCGHISQSEIDALFGC